MGFMDKARELLDQHDDKADQALDKGGDMAKQRFAGHDEHIDTRVDKLQEMPGEADTTRAHQEERPPPPQ